MSAVTRTYVVKKARCHIHSERPKDLHTRAQKTTRFYDSQMAEAEASKAHIRYLIDCLMTTCRYIKD